MTPGLILAVIGAYFAVLFVVARVTGRGADNSGFFIGNRNSPWYVVAFGMIGASLSGVTFISIPGWVADTGFGYMQMVLGYLVGYAVIGFVLIPLYYKLNLISIYGYLAQRFGPASYRTGASFFLLSRLVGASFRLFLVAGVLDAFVLGPFGIPFWATVLATIALIWVYTAEGGIRTIVWTDTIQTAAMLAAVVLAVVFIGRELGLGPGCIVHAVAESEFSTIFHWGDFAGSGNHFAKQFLSGALIAVVMTGLDQDMMQKNLSCRNERESRRNVLSMSWALIPVNLLFLSLGALLYIYAAREGIAVPAKADHLFPTIALEHMPVVVGVVFTLGLIAAAYSSADSALTSLTTSFCVDILGVEHRPDEEARRMRRRTHIAMSVVLAVVIYGFSFIGDESVIGQVFRFAGFTYGPLLGLFAYGLLTREPVADRFVPMIALTSVALTIGLHLTSEPLLGYTFGYELLLVNGTFTFVGLAISRAFTTTRRHG